MLDMISGCTDVQLFSSSANAATSGSRSLGSVFFLLAAVCMPQILPAWNDLLTSMLTNPLSISTALQWMRMLQITFPPPNVGYDHNWALFGLGYDSANKTHVGAISNE